MRVVIPSPALRARDLSELTSTPPPGQFGWLSLQRACGKALGMNINLKGFKSRLFSWLALQRKAVILAVHRNARGIRYFAQHPQQLGQDPVLQRGRDLRASD